MKRRNKSASVTTFPTPPSEFLTFEGDPGCVVDPDEIAGLRIKGGTPRALVMRGGCELEISRQYGTQKVLDMISEARK